MSPAKVIINLYCRVDEIMDDVPQHGQALLSPSEIVTLGFLFVLKGVGQFNRRREQLTIR